jgi:hypothetical protein
MLNENFGILYGKVLTENINDLCPVDFFNLLELNGLAPKDELSSMDPQKALHSLDNNMCPVSRTINRNYVAEKKYNIRKAYLDLGKTPLERVTRAFKTYQGLCRSPLTPLEPEIPNQNLVEI